MRRGACVCACVGRGGGGRRACLFRKQEKNVGAKQNFAATLTFFYIHNLKE